LAGGPHHSHTSLGGKLAGRVEQAGFANTELTGDEQQRRSTSRDVGAYRRHLRRASDQSRCGGLCRRIIRQLVSTAMGSLERETTWCVELECIDQ
jgi:hypothetical protein